MTMTFARALGASTGMDRPENFSRSGWLAIALCLCAFFVSPAAAQDPDRRPNVVFIILDDLNEYVGFLGGHPQSLTPNMDALAARSVSFTDAYPTLPICAPSRASLFSGIQPFNSGSMSFGKWFQNDTLRNSRTLMEYFRANGYRTLGTGKIFHDNVGYLWDEFHGKVDYGPVWMSAGEPMAHPSVARPFGDIGAIDGSFAAMTATGVVDDQDKPYSGWWSIPHKRPVRFASETDRDPLPDEISARWAAQQLSEMGEAGDDEPFFLAVGLLKPHTPLHVPKSYFDRLPEEADIIIPNYDPADANDTFYRDVFDSETRGILLFDTLARSYPSVEEGLRAFIRAYLASIAFADDQVGTIIEAVERSPYADNTIIVLTSDHGWTNGEKNVLFKNNLWQSGSRVPFLIYRPGHSARTLEAPVSLIDIYPTLAELAGLEGDTRKNAKGHVLDGKSLVPYMDARKGSAPEFALGMLKSSNLEGSESWQPARQHYSITTSTWRYIRYNTGQEELYERSKDPQERSNLAHDQGADASVKAVLGDMRRKLDTAVPGVGASRGLD